ncbi:MAG: prephenate dehydratase [Bacteroidia bacterium]
METGTGTEQRIAIQGVLGSFHEIAARQFFGPGVVLDMCDTFPELFRKLAEGQARYGVVAIENTVAGSLLPNYALLRNSALHIIGEVYLRIEHSLMALPGQRIEDLREVHSHPMALQQCQDFLAEYPDLRAIERPDTAGSAQWIAETGSRGVAAIGAALAAQHYGLEVLRQGIESNHRNYTRFLVLLDKDAARRLPLRPDKASLCFHLSHKVGSLSQILLVLSSHGMNLTKIQSLPLVGQEWEYFFHIDLEYDDHAQYQRALAAIQSLVAELKILGEYPRGIKPRRETPTETPAQQPATIEP